MAKQELYSTMMDRMKEADAAGFFLESVTLAYAILEDRTSSMLKAVNKTPGGKMLYDKTVALAWRAHEKDSGLAVYLHDNEHVAPSAQEIAAAKAKKLKNRDDEADEEQIKKLPGLKRLRKFSKSRNELIHAMADGTISYEQLQKEAKSLSALGLELVQTFTSIARKVKSHGDHL